MNMKEIQILSDSEIEQVAGGDLGVSLAVGASANVTGIDVNGLLGSTFGLVNGLLGNVFGLLGKLGL